MALNIMNAKLAGKTAGPMTVASSKTETAPVLYWINIGTESEIMDPVTLLPHFLPLSLGIPFDRCELFNTETRNEEYNLLNAAKNDVHAIFVDAFSELAPGEEKRIPLGDTGLVMQLRRVADKQAHAPIPADQNPHRVRVKL